LLSPVDTGIVDLKSQTDAVDMLFNRIENAKTEINSEWFSTDEIERQHQILDQSAALIRQVLQAQTVSHDSLRDFAKRMGPLMLANAWDVVCAQIKATHNQMMIWKESLSSEDWQQPFLSFPFRPLRLALPFPLFLFEFGFALHTPFITAHGAFAVLQLRAQDDLNRNLRNSRFNLALLIILLGNADVFRTGAHENR
jgi:hypothetical protein